MSGAVQTPARPAAQLRIDGVLTDHAQALHTPGHNSHALLQAVIDGGQGLPFVVLQDLGTGPSAHIAAESKARLLRRGMRVLATAGGAVPRTDHDRAVLRLVDLTDLIPVPTQTPAPSGPESEPSHDA